MLREIKKKERIKILNDIEKNGYSLVKELIKNKNVNILLNKLKEVYKKTKLVNKKKYNGVPKRDAKDLRIYNLPQKDKLFIDLITHKEIEKILIPLLNDPYYRYLPKNLPNYIVGSSTARSSGNLLDLHIDSMFPFTGKQPISMLLLFVIEEMYQENGGTVVVPKSHLSGTYTDRKTKKKISINGKPGDLLIIDSRTWHGTSENKTNKSRWLINTLLTQWWLKQQVDIPSSIPKKILNQITNKQKQILGFCSIPPKSEKDRINTKCGYEIFKNVST